MKHIRYIYIGIFFLLILCAFVEPHRRALRIAKSNEQNAVRSLVAIGLVDGMVTVGKSSKIPFISNVCSGVKNVVSKAFSYMFKINMLAATQYFLLKLAQSRLFKLLLILFFLLYTFNISSELMFKCTVTLLLISPGLNLVISGSNLLEHEISKDGLSNVRKSAESIRSKMTIHTDVGLNEKWNQRQELLVKHGKRHALLRHIKQENYPKRMQNRVKHKIRTKMVNLLTNTLENIIGKVLFFFGLPIFYSFVVYLFIKKLLRNQATPKLQFRTLIGLLMLAVAVTACSSVSDEPDTETPEVSNEETSSIHLKAKRPPISGMEQLLKSKESITEDTLRGIDVSHYNGNVDWEEVASKGNHFAYAKCTEGTRFVDPKFAKNWSGMKEARIARGAYHFYSASEDPRKQADIFTSTVGEITMNDLPPMLDLEGIQTGTGGLSKDVYMNNVLLWLELIEDHYKRIPVIYTNNPFANAYLTRSEFAKYPLWIAEYGPIARVPRTWKSEGEKWLIWQHTSREKMTGINGTVDGDLLVGDATLLFQTR